MRNLILYFMAVFGISNCAPPANGLIQYPVELEPFIRNYEDLKIVYFGKPDYYAPIYIYFSNDFNGNTRGRCKHRIFDNFFEQYEFKEIHISREFWENSSRTEKEILVFHELGHCDLELPHSDEGIMQTWALDSFDFNLHRDYYIKQFFNSVLE